MASPILVFAFSGCSLFRGRQGPKNGGYVIDTEAPDEAQARRLAVAAFFEAYASSSSWTQAESLAAGSTTYVTQAKTLSTRGEGAAKILKVRSLVDYQKLGRDLEAAGLVKPAGVVGQPKAAVWIDEAGPGADPGNGRAAEAVRFALAERGYPAYALGREENEAAATEKARAEGAALLVAGTARSTPGTAATPGFSNVDASLELRIIALPKGEVVDDVSASASAVDLAADSAAAKALANVGELAADKVKRFLPTRFVERTETTVLILGLGGLPEILKLLRAVRRERRVIAAALAQAGGGDAKLRVWVERMTPDEVAAVFLKLPGYSFTVRSVAPEFNAVELDTSGEAPF